MRGSGSTGSCRGASHPCTPLEGSHWRHSKVRRKERENRSVRAGLCSHTGHRLSPAAARMHSLTPSLLPAKPKGVGGIKKGLFFPIPISFLSMGYKKCLFAGLPFGKGKKHCPFCDTRELDLWTYSMAVGLSDECLMC